MASPRSKHGRASRASLMPPLASACREFRCRRCPFARWPARVRTHSARVEALHGVGSVAEAVGARRGRPRMPACCCPASPPPRSPARLPREACHDGPFHRRRPGRRRSRDGAWPRSHRALPGLSLCRFDHPARDAVAGVRPAPASSIPRPSISTRSSRNSSARTRPGRTWRGFNRAISRSGARWGSNSAASTRSTSPIR